MKRAFLFLLLLAAAAQGTLHAESEQKLLERQDSYLTAGDMRGAVGARAAWLAHDIGDRLAAPPPAKNSDPHRLTEFKLTVAKREFDRLYANRDFKYKQPPVPAKWSALTDSYKFGHAKGVFDAICADMPPNYDGSGERYEAFCAGYASGFKLGKAQRQ